MAHLHRVYDTDAHFKIDAITRAIKADTSGKSVKTVLIQGDHNSERFTFEVPRLVDGHDLSLCNDVQVHYINIDSGNKSNTSRDIYLVTDLQISPDSDDVVILSWLIDGKATRYAGSLHFLVKFKCIADDETVDYVWNTAIFTGISVSTGIDNVGSVATEYSDILAALISRIEELEEGGVGGSSARVAEVTLLSANWAGDDNPYSQVVTIDGITANSQVDLTPSVEQLAIFYDKSIAFVAENKGGVVTVYAIGQKPENDYTMQVTITEVSA